MNATRQNLINAAKQLLAERGYDATSPSQILALSGCGKGSFYHHFKGKKELCIAAMEDRVDELIHEFNELFMVERPINERLERYFLKPRDGLAGCRIGRIVQDPSIIDPEFHKPLQRYFAHLADHIEKALQAAIDEQQIEPVDPTATSAALLAALQGGFVLARATQQSDKLQQAIKGVLCLVKPITPQS